MVVLGTKYKDTVSGFVGIAMAYHTYLYGCVRVTLQPAIDKDGKLPDVQTFDEPQLEVIEETALKGDTSTGGPEKYPDSRNY